MKNKTESTSLSRYERMSNLLTDARQINVSKAAAILRDRKGPYEKGIGEGNEQAINQLTAHHSVIFKPEEMLAWVSTNPWQLGEFVCYRFDSAFAKSASMETANEIYEKSMNIAADTFLYSKKYFDFLAFRIIKKYVQYATKHTDHKASEVQLLSLVYTNPDYYYAYALTGEYYLAHGNKREAKKYFTIALLKEPSSLGERNKIEKQLRECD
jgi:hypothetical protein